jgi:hypothetical protein
MTSRDARRALLAIVVGWLPADVVAQASPFLFDVPLSLSISGEHSVTADLDGDGWLDLASTRSSLDRVSVLLRDEQGSFAAPVHYSVGDEPNFVAAADLNGDGQPDLIVANGGSDSVSVLLATGAGGFGAAATFAAGIAPTGVAVGDVTGDDMPDLVVSNLASTVGAGTVSILAGLGDGEFGPPAQIAVGGNLYAVVLIDLDGDGWLDITVADGYQNARVVVLPGAGDGVFGPPVSVPVGSKPRSVVSVDLDVDGVPDLLTGNYGGDGVSVLLGSGDGSFQAAVDYPFGDQPVSVIAADLDGDGIPDVATADLVPAANDSVTVRQGLAGGELGPSTSYDLSDSVASVVAGDMNGDGSPDLVVSMNGGPTRIYQNAGNGSFVLPTTWPTTAPALDIASGDMDNDGRLDLVVLGTGFLSVLLGQGDGAFDSPRDEVVSSTAGCIALDDFNDDGQLDVVVGNGSAHAGVQLMRGQGTGGLEPVGFVPAGKQVRGIDTADIDSDSHVDLVVAMLDDDWAGAVGVILGQGHFAFAPVVVIPLIGYPDSLSVGDVSGDGFADVVMAMHDGIAVLVAQADGTLGAPVYQETHLGDGAVALADLDGDGWIDIVSANHGWPYDMSVLFGAGAGAFEAPLEFFGGSGPEDIVLADIDGDERLDALVLNTLSVNDPSWVSVLSGLGRAGFGPLTGYSVVGRAQALACGDFDGNGALDLATPDVVDPAVAVLLNHTGWSWLDLGFSLAGAAGVPSLAGSGTLTLGGTGALTLSGAAAASPAMLFLSVGSAPAAFKCGTLAAFPPSALVPLTTSGTGGLALGWSSWGIDLPGIPLVFQIAVADLGAPCGVSLSNALQPNVR